MLSFKDDVVIGYDLFNAPEDYKVVTVNCVGAMGRGVALSCRDQYPKLYRDYQARCREKGIVTGKAYLYEKERIILLPTKTHWRLPSTVDIILDGIDGLLDLVDGMGISLAIPPLGMANGWLKPEQRRAVFLHLIRTMLYTDVNCTVYLPTSLYQESRMILKHLR